MSKDTDSLGRARRPTQGGAGPKHLPDKTKARKAGKFDASPPPDLGPHGLFAWEYTVRTTTKMGILDEGDWISLCVLVRAYEGYMLANEDIKANGREMMDDHGNKKRNTAYSTLKERTNELRSSLSDFALTPSARAKFGATGDDEEDPFQKLIRKSAEGN